MSFRKIFPLIATAVAVWLGLRYLLPVALPFLLAGLLAVAAEPLVGFFDKKMKLPRGVATGIGVSMSLVLLALFVMVLVALMLRQVQGLAGVLPDIEGTAVEGLNLLEQWLLGLLRSAPKGIGTMLTGSVQALFSDGTAVLERVVSWLLGLASGVLSRLPDSALGLFTWLLASYMISAKLPNIRLWLQKKLPPVWRETYLPGWKRIKRAVLGWLKAQIKLIGVTFLVLTAGFSALQISRAPLWAAVIALLDALPVLGTGTVLVPWSVVCFLQGDMPRGIGLLGVFAAASLLRSVLEPRLVGKQLGLDPLITLVAMYTGYRLFGIGGMIFAPLLAVAVVQMLPRENRGEHPAL